MPVSMSLQRPHRKDGSSCRGYVHARGASPMRGYEGFEAVTSKIYVLAYLGVNDRHDP